MRYTPGKINDKITDTAFTEGGEYMDLLGKEFRGFIHKIGKLYFSGKTHTDESRPLLPLNPSPLYLTYLKVKGWFYNNFTDPKDFLPSPGEKDYEQGYIDRFFIRKRNQPQSRIIELDEKQYKSIKTTDAGIDGFSYYGMTLEWKITGPKHDKKFGSVVQQSGVYDTNEKTLVEYEKDMQGITRKLSNFLQFARLS